MFIAIEATQNPSRIRFLPDQAVLPAGTAGFLNSESAARSPLAARIFAIDGIKAVFLDTHAINVVKTDESEWPLIKILVNGAITEHYQSGDVVILDADQPMPRPGLETSEAKAIQALLDQSINPQVASHGGKINLVDVQEDLVFITMEGACQGCGMANVTLKQGVAKHIMGMIPKITDVLDSTDHASGTNPYHTSGKGAPSPFHQPAK